MQHQGALLTLADKPSGESRQDFGLPGSQLSFGSPIGDVTRGSKDGLGLVGTNAPAVPEQPRKLVQQIVEIKLSDFLRTRWKSLLARHTEKGPARRLCEVLEPLDQSTLAGALLPTQ
jgi:hypothetical protein